MNATKNHTLPKFLICCALFLCAISGGKAIAQRGGGAAKGGSNRPDRERPQPEEQKSTLRKVIGVIPTATPSPTPEASPSPEPKKLCDSQKAGKCPGTFKFIYGVNINDRARHPDAASQKTAGGFAFNVYVTRRIFVEIDNDNFVSMKPLTGNRVTGFGDTVLSLGGDPLLEREGSSRPGISVTYSVKVPSASAVKGLGSGEVDHTLTGTVYKTHRKVHYFELDFSENFSGRTGSTGFDKSSGLTGLYEWTQSDKNTIHFELGGTFATKSSNAEMHNLNFLEHTINDHVLFRIGGRFGLTPNAPRIGFYAALILKGNLRQIF